MSMLGCLMALPMTIAIRSLEMIFAVGVIGSVFVLVLTIIEDIGELSGDKKPDHEISVDYSAVGSNRYPTQGSVSR
jgi:hypothetical protein